MLLLGGHSRATLLLTGTPHQGSNERFIHLLRLLDPDLFRDPAVLLDDPAAINSVVVRNRKREVTDVDGRRLFDPPPIVRDQPLDMDPSLRQFQDELSAYLGQGYRSVTGGTTRAIGFVMTTFAKLASSSPTAIRLALERRLLQLDSVFSSSEDTILEDDRYQGEQDESRFLSGNVPGANMLQRGLGAEFFADERPQVERLIELAGRCETSDAKLTKLLELINALLDRNPEERVLIFTEYRGTQELLVRALSATYPDLDVVTIHGSKSLGDKREAVRRFNSSANFLVSTEAGGEGINLQERCHLMVNYDLPWNPMRLHQRIGRLYRYGQEHQVQVLNLRMRNTVDDRVLRFLETKIDQIAADLAGLKGPILRRSERT